jgi:hypothetical protein
MTEHKSFLSETEVKDSLLRLAVAYTKHLLAQHDNALDEKLHILTQPEHLFWFNLNGDSARC